MKHFTKEEIAEILKKHKNVSVAYTEFDRERVLNNPSTEGFRTGLKSKLEEFKKTPTAHLSFSLFRRYEEDGDRLNFENQYFDRRRKLLAYALEYWLYREEEYLVLLQDIIWTILEEYTWSLPAHLRGSGLKKVQKEGTYVVDLFAAETGQALSETLSLIGDDIHPIIKERIHLEIERRIFANAYEDNGGAHWWHNTTNNWSAVCSGSVGMAAIYEIEDEDRLAYYIEKTLETLENFYRGFPEDGACLEGLNYWDYGFGYFMCFADMLYRRTEGEINLFDDAHIKEAAFFYTKVFFKGTRTVSFADASTSGRCSPAALSILSKYYPDYRIPTSDFIAFGYSGMGCARFALSLRNAVTAREDLKTCGEQIVGTYKLPDAGWYISSSECGIGIAAKAGHNNEPHNHNDVGSFIIYKNGEAMITDIGSGEYTRQYFSSERYDIFCNSSRSHSVPIINGEYQISGEEHCGNDVKITDNGLYADISKAYDISSLKALLRKIDFDRSSGAVTVYDEFKFDETPSSVVERFITPKKPQILSDKVVITTGNEKSEIFFDKEKCSASCELVIDKAHMGNDRETYVIDFTIKNPEKEFSAKFLIK